MKIMALILLSVLSFSLFAKYQFMPDNDLWKEDGQHFRGSGISQEMFVRIIAIANEIYQPFAKQNNEKLVINNKWTNSTVNADCSRYRGTVTVNMYGGLARRPEVNAEGFALVLCHELGHAYGGYPYIYEYAKMSAEGQADYYGAKECHEMVMDKMRDVEVGEATEYMMGSCGANDLCLRGLVGGQSLGTLLATLGGNAAPDYETPDKTVVTKTETSYPKTTQCRLDTYYNGVLHLDRPACWFKN